MASCISSGGRININPPRLILFVDIFATEQIAAKFELPPFNEKMFLGWDVQGRTAPSRRIVEVLKAKREERKKENSTSILAIVDLSLLQEACTDQVRQNVRAPTAVLTYAASDVGVREWFFWLFPKKIVAAFFEQQHVLQK